MRVSDKDNVHFFFTLLCVEFHFIQIDVDVFAGILCAHNFPKSKPINFIHAELLTWKTNVFPQLTQINLLFTHLRSLYSSLFPFSALQPVNGFFFSRQVLSWAAQYILCSIKRAIERMERRCEEIERRRAMKRERRCWEKEEKERHVKRESITYIIVRI